MPKVEQRNVCSSVWGPLGTGKVTLTHEIQSKHGIDDFGRNVHHFAARGGHLHIINYLIDPRPRRRGPRQRRQNNFALYSYESFLGGSEGILPFHHSGWMNNNSWSPLHGKPGLAGQRSSNLLNLQGSRNTWYGLPNLLDSGAPFHLLSFINSSRL